MSFSDQQHLIIEALQTALAGTPVKWPNAAFTTPTSGIWARVNIVTHSNEVFGLASSDKNTGYIQVDIFAAKDTGDLAAVGKAQSVAAAIQRRTMSRNKTKVMTYSSRINPMPLEATWFGVQLLVDFVSLHGV